MISFTCAACSQLMTAPDGTAGDEAACPACDAANMVPIDIDCDGDHAAPDAQTVPIHELKALCRGK